LPKCLKLLPMQYMGKYIIIAGIILIIIGVIIYFGHNRLHWFGHLPGDIHIKKEHFSFYFPITSMIIVSILLSAIIWITQKLR